MAGLTKSGQGPRSGNYLAKLKKTRRHCDTSKRVMFGQ
jgi:hypothetical protein